MKTKMLLSLTVLNNMRDTHFPNFDKMNDKRSTLRSNIT